MFDRTAQCKEQTRASPPSTPRTAGRSGPGLDATDIEQALAAAAEAAPRWAATPVDERCRIVRRAADILRARRAELAALFTLEMGKLVEQARDEVEKCAAGCEYYADHAPGFITDVFVV